MSATLTPRILVLPLKPERSFLVYSGTDRYPKSDDVEAIGLADLAALLREIN